MWQCFNNLVHWTAQQIPAHLCLLPYLTSKTFLWRLINNKYIPKEQWMYKNYSNAISYTNSKWQLALCSWESSCLKTKVIIFEDINVNRKIKVSILFVRFFCLSLECTGRAFCLPEKKNHLILRKYYEKMTSICLWN